MKTETIAQEALRLLSPIPKEDFIKGNFTNGENKCCAVGHYQRLKSKDPNNFNTINCHDFSAISGIREKSIEYLDKYEYNRTISIAEVNNNTNINGYNEPEIKDRVIHLLNDMIAAGY